MVLNLIKLWPALFPNLTCVSSQGHSRGRRIGKRLAEETAVLARPVVALLLARRARRPRPSDTSSDVLPAPPRPGGRPQNWMELMELDVATEPPRPPLDPSLAPPAPFVAAAATP